jgi:hypothetical protein
VQLVATVLLAYLPVHRVLLVKFLILTSLDVKTVGLETTLWQGIESVGVASQASFLRAMGWQDVAYVQLVASAMTLN